MRSASFHAHLLVAVMLLTSAACGPSFPQVLKQAKPNPFPEQQRFAVEPIAIDKLRYGEQTFADYVETRPPAYKERWTAIPPQLDGWFRERLDKLGTREQIAFIAPAQKTNELVIRVLPVELIRGKSQNLLVRAKVKFSDADGRTLDAIIVESRSGEARIASDDPAAWRTLMRGLATQVMVYLMGRIGPPPQG